MRRRAEHVDQTRLRITEAAVRLHTTIGPANTSIASIAEEAGVTRLTVYRHFGDLDTLFEACMGHWRAENPPPDVGSWSVIADLEARARLALGVLYGWYRNHADEMTPVYRDASTMPLTAQQAMDADNEALGAALVTGHDEPGSHGRALRAVARHLVGFETWRSFAIQQGLDDPEIVDIAVRFLLTVADEGPEPRTRALS